MRRARFRSDGGCGWQRLDDSEVQRAARLARRPDAAARKRTAVLTRGTHRVTRRHSAFPTTDIPSSSLPGIDQRVRLRVRQRVLAPAASWRARAPFARFPSPSPPPPTPPPPPRRQLRSRRARPPALPPAALPQGRVRDERRPVFPGPLLCALRRGGGEAELPRGAQGREPAVVQRAAVAAGGLRGRRDVLQRHGRDVPDRARGVRGAQGRGKDRPEENPPRHSGGASADASSAAALSEGWAGPAAAGQPTLAHRCAATPKLVAGAQRVSAPQRREGGLREAARPRWVRRERPQPRPRVRQARPPPMLSRCAAAAAATLLFARRVTERAAPLLRAQAQDARGGGGGVRAAGGGRGGRAGPLASSRRPRRCCGTAP